MKSRYAILDYMVAQMKTVKLFEQLSAQLHQSDFKIQVNHENLETVYVEATPDGRVLIHDHAHAHTYLSADGDCTYRDWTDLGLSHLQQHCDQLELSLENLFGDDSDPGFCICGRASTDDEVAEFVNRVAFCQDAIFQSALRVPT